MPALMNTAISLIFVFLAISLIVTSVNEMISHLLRKRADILMKGISEFIDSDYLRDLFYKNGLVSRSKGVSDQVGSTNSNGTHPSYIEPEMFARALTMVAGLDDNTLKISLEKIKETVAKDGVVNTKIRDVLVSALAEAGDSVEKFQKSLETWFQTAMDRLSGDFKRYSQRISFVLGLVIAVSLNVDAYSVSMRVGQSPDKMDSYVSGVMKMATNDMDVSSKCKKLADSDNSFADIKCLADNIGVLFSQLSDAPIGWPDPVYAALAPKLKESGNVGYFALLAGYGLLKLLGWLATAFAVTLGAPFWFDLLKGFVNIRSTGDKPKGPVAATGQ